MNKVLVDKKLLSILLKKTILFYGLKEKDLNLIIDLINTYKVFKKEKIILEGEKGQDIFVVLNGRINVYFEEGKKKIILKTLNPGDIFGEIGYFTKKRIASCVALEDSTIGVIKYKDFKKLILIKKDLFLNFIKVLISRLIETNQGVKKLAFKPVLYRIAEEILCNLNKEDNLDISIKELAEKVAASRETVSRMLKILEKIGAISRQKNNIKVLNKEKLLNLMKQ